MLSIDRQESLPSDAEMIAQFEHHRADFERLRQMLAEDPMVTMVSDTEVHSRDAKSLPKDRLSPQRWQAYRVLFRRIDPVSRVFQDPDGSLSIEVAYAGLLSMSTREKGYAFLKAVPARNALCSDLDDFVAPQKVSGCYRSLGGGWYLYLFSA